jgi:hypothetical protein
MALPTTSPGAHGHHVRTAHASVSSEAIRLAKAASAGTGTDFRSLLASGLQESHYDPTAQNRRSSAAGAFQFTDRTWLDLVHRHGAELGHADEAAQVTEKGGAPSVADPATRQRILALRSDTPFAGALAARYFDENRAHLAKSLGKEPSENEVRMAYLLGASGATHLIKAAETTPSVPSSHVVPSAVRRNPRLFHNKDGSVKTAAEAVASLNRHFDAAAERIDRAVEMKLSMK